MTKATMPEPRWYAAMHGHTLYGVYGTPEDAFDAVSDTPCLMAIGRLITTTQAEAYKDACVRDALEAVGAGGVSGQQITQPSTDETQSAWFAGIDAGREIERHNSQLDNCGLTY